MHGHTAFLAVGSDTRVVWLADLSRFHSGPGDARVTRLDDPAVKVVVERPCRICQGTGRLSDGFGQRTDDCPVCDGASVVYVVSGDSLPLRVDVPA